MRRLQPILIGACAALLLATSVAAQQRSPGGMPRIGILTSAENERTPLLEAFREGLRELGYIEGRSIVLEYRFARGDYSQFPRLPADLVNLPVTVILTDGGGAVADAAKAATTTIPIVLGTAGDPVAQGLVADHARPSGNITGFALVSVELNVKRLELLRRAFPETRSVNVLFNPLNQIARVGLREVEASAKSLGLSRIHWVEADAPDALRALTPEALDRTAPLLVVPDAMFWNRRRDIVALAMAARAPALYPEREYADDGGLIAYGPSVADNFRRAAGYVDRILKGANPGDLPIQQPERFELVINLKTARTLGLDLPPTLLAAADEVIE